MQRSSRRQSRIPPRSKVARRRRADHRKRDPFVNRLRTDMESLSVKVFVGCRVSRSRQAAAAPHWDSPVRLSRTEAYVAGWICAAVLFRGEWRSMFVGPIPPRIGRVSLIRAIHTSPPAASRSGRRQCLPGLLGQSTRLHSVFKDAQMVCAGISSEQSTNSAYLNMRRPPAMCTLRSDSDGGFRRSGCTPAPSPSRRPDAPAGLARASPTAGADACPLV